MMDILFIEQLTVMAFIGIHDWEKKCLQKLIFDLKLAYNAKFVLNNERIMSYVDYTHVSQTIFDIVNRKHFFLIEDVANVVANILIQKFCIFWVYIKLSKPGAVYGASNVGICIKRKNKMFFNSFLQN